MHAHEHITLILHVAHHDCQVLFIVLAVDVQAKLVLSQVRGDAGADHSFDL